MKHWSEASRQRRLTPHDPIDGSNVNRGRASVNEEILSQGRENVLSLSAAKIKKRFEITRGRAGEIQILL